MNHKNKTGMLSADGDLYLNNLDQKWRETDSNGVYNQGTDYEWK
jgi:hypothetical protein